ncbi:MAG: site-specific DNA-methyltransferase [Candidatus Dormibacteraeota bacterium]|nr:site-specific DNA-methyltransferase [Candidatus Dormibacteraeota bacterium]
MALARAMPSVPDWRIEQQDCIDFLRSLPSKSVDVIVTDPAYSGMNQHMRFGHGRIVGHYGKPGNRRWFREFHDNVEAYREFLEQCRRVLRDNRHIYIMFDSYSLLSLGALVRDFFDVKGIVVWDKVAIGMGHYFRRRHEHIVFASKGRKRLARRDLPDVWTVPRIRRASYPTQKPVALFELMLAGSAGVGDVVCDPFCGSGSSAIAALRSGCSYVGSDVDPDAVELARARCDTFTAVGADPLEATPRSR